MAIDFDTETIMTLRDAAKHVGKTYFTLYRWWKEGLRIKNGKRPKTIKLETCRLPEGRGTSIEAVQRFIAALNGK